MTSTRWFFKGGAYEGSEVTQLLDDYMGWLWDVVVPKAEDLTE